MEQRQSFCFERHVATSQLVVDRRTFSKAKKISWVVLLTTGRGAPWYDDEGERRWKSLKQLSEQKGGTRRPSTVMYLPLFESTAAYTSLLVFLVDTIPSSFPFEKSDASPRLLVNSPGAALCLHVTLPQPYHRLCKMHQADTQCWCPS